jgi:hypothetical protein
MKLVQRIDRLVRAINGAITVLKFIVALFAALVGFSVVVAVAAYLKREQWTKPAYRWARDTSGRWSVTPWTPADKVAS